MAKALSLVVFLALTACAGVPQRQHAASPCATNPNAPACQPEMYHRAP